MSEKKYKILKNFTPRDLYEAHAPIELFLKHMEFSGNYVDAVYVLPKFFEQGMQSELATFKHWDKWLIENKFVEEIEEDIELKPGMILEEDLFGYQYVVTNNGLYCSKGFIEKVIGNPSDYYKDCKTLQELNNKSGYKWRILY